MWEVDDDFAHIIVCLNANMEKILDFFVTFLSYLYDLKD